MGCGWYSKKMGYEQWFTFNNAIRAHYNFLEGIGLIIVMILVAGIHFVPWAYGFGFAYCVSRIIYTEGYIRKGPAGRGLGALLVDICILGLLILSVWSCIKIIKEEKVGV
mmetsp:Transcript_80770/g.112196  ORF Transcript_80770/g.112196 Transcript_80770/m.112196 type:complete len:110 (-) Transcript_80770:48-377(-)